MITDADIKKLKLERFLTKKDFKKEINKYATKDALEKLDARTAEGFLNVQTQLNEIKGDISGMKGDISDLKNTMLTIQDNLIGEIHKLHIENKVTATYRPKIENHEERITKVEAVVFAS
ncbi:MAG TPA: hypothetical protein VLH94_00925 [Spirochaetia bacterium]|nr:hypothetical protein [Spirochaetia bacterium]